MTVEFEGWLYSQLFIDSGGVVGVKFRGVIEEVLAYDRDVD
jgi:hypothetical protein